MKNARFTEVMDGVIGQLLSVKEGLVQTITPDKTPYEVRKEWNEKTLADIRAMPPEEAIKGLMKHRSK